MTIIYSLTPGNFSDDKCYRLFSGALFRDFSSDGCYKRSLARPNEGVMAFIGVNGARFLLVKWTYSLFYNKFP